ncbi:unnamed protein product [Nippostrongylus brasiliensis]|uniref:Serum response factor-binding protein 1 n=1 Tax=Nippostrongylus brasiliensis TaxID=27835 RepID=A0A0N4XW66_NIPBR|nr:unnamed protein product [Nippostrongylus brasiliensis]
MLENNSSGVVCCDLLALPLMYDSSFSILAAATALLGAETVMVAGNSRNALTIPKNTQPESEDENFEVADLSSVPAPEVEFVMPNLTPLPLAKPKEKRVVKKKKKQLGFKDDILTADKLNSEIVRLRPIVQKGRSFLLKHLIRKIKHMKKILEKKPSDALQRKIRRYEEEIHAMKGVAKDEVSKFALINKKSLDLLGITENTPAPQRCLYKLACQECVVKAVEDYRSRYSAWEVTTAYLLQRLGLQYKDNLKETETENALSLIAETSEGSSNAQKKNSKKTIKSKIPKEEKAEEYSETTAEIVDSVQPSCSDSDGPLTDDEDDASESGNSSEECDVEIGSDSDDEGEQMAERRRNLLLGKDAQLKIASKALNTREARRLPLKSESTKRPAVDSQAFSVVKQIKLDKGGKVKLANADERVIDEPSEKVEEESDDDSHGNFFLPASKLQDLSHLHAPDPHTVKTNGDSEITRLKIDKNESRGTRERLKTHRGKNLEKVNRLKKIPETKHAAEDLERLHPSWAARRQAKEKQMSAPQGKRIVFDEE